MRNSWRNGHDAGMNACGPGLDGPVTDRAAELGIERIEGGEGDLLAIGAPGRAGIDLHAGLRRASDRPDVPAGDIDHLDCALESLRTLISGGCRGIDARHEGDFLAIGRPVKRKAMPTVGLSKEALVTALAVHNPEASREKGRRAIVQAFVG